MVFETKNALRVSRPIHFLGEPGAEHHDRLVLDAPAILSIPVIVRSQKAHLFVYHRCLCVIFVCYLFDSVHSSPNDKMSGKAWIHKLYSTMRTGS